MQMNFCDSKLLPHISCDKISVDGYGVDNLISGDIRSRQHGFIAEYYIKPPVTITVSFPCNIEIHSIVINPCVSAQKSSGFEIYTLSNKVDSQLWLNRGDHEKPDIIKSQDKSSNYVYKPIGKAILSKPEPVCFHNRSFRSVSFAQTYHSSNCKHVFELRNRNQEALNYVSSINIRIVRSVAGRSIAVKSVEVWGQISRSVPRYIQKQIVDLYNYEKKASETLDTCTRVESLSNSEESFSQVKEQGFIENGVEVPEDFIDAITCDIMKVPLLLPSGKSIDQSTLEKHNSAEASWGRLPSDPFTGLVFNDKSKPVPNVPLKVRIDKFILSNNEKLGHLPRVLGGQSNSYSHQNDNRTNISRLVDCFSESNSSDTIRDYSYCNRNSRKRCREISETDSANQKYGGFDIKEPPIKQARTHSENFKSISAIVPCKNKLKSNDKQVIDLTTGDKNQDKANSISQKQPQNYSSFIDGQTIDLTDDKNQDNIDNTSHHCQQNVHESHEQELEQSMKSAYESVLSHLPSFTKIQKKNPEKQHEDKDLLSTQLRTCALCGGNGAPIYRGPCGHVFCRPCITIQSNIQGGYFFDKICGERWKTNQILRVH